MQNPAKKDLSDGYYTKKTGDQKKSVYLDVEGDSLRVYPTTTRNQTFESDTIKPSAIHISSVKTGGGTDFTLSKKSFDIDFLTVPAKFRFASEDVPPQLNSELSAAIFIGYRTDKYHITHTIDALGNYERNIDHLGYAVGLFTGFGNTFISPTTTSERVQQEYDGIVWSKGLAFIVALNRISLGLAIGFDNLTDKNYRAWVYENKPWVGFAIGLNLN